MIAWSHSVLESVETCAWRHYQTKVLKSVIDTPGEAMMRGRAVHKSMENRVKHGKPLTPELIKHEPLVQRLIDISKGGRLEAETQMALDQNYKPTSWFGKQTWVRSITDLSILKGARAFVADWKTGKRKTEATTQLQLSSVVMFATHPELEEVRNSFVWLDEPDPTLRLTVETYTRDQAPDIWREFLPRVARLEAAHASAQWPKRPSGLCKNHCPVPRSVCEHSG